MQGSTEPVTWIKAHICMAWSRNDLMSPFELGHQPTCCGRNTVGGFKRNGSQGKVGSWQESWGYYRQHLYPLYFPPLVLCLYLVSWYQAIGTRESTNLQKQVGRRHKNVEGTVSERLGCRSRFVPLQSVLPKNLSWSSRLFPDASLPLSLTLYVHHKMLSAWLFD